MSSAAPLLMDRGMISEENIECLRESDRRYIVGTPKSLLKKFERQLLSEDWHTIRDGLEEGRRGSGTGHNSARAAIY